MRNSSFKYFLLCVTSLMLVACTTIKVERVDIDKQIDFSGSWNDSDAMTVSKTMVADCLEKQWHTNFMKGNGRNPIVIVGHVSNNSHEHINTNVLTKYLERELLNSGKVVFVATADERDGLRAERTDQQKGFTDPSSMAAVGRERGADYMLIGSVDSIKDEVKGKFVIFYQVNMEMIDLRTNEKVWIGQRQLKKKVKKSKFSI